MTKHGPSNGSWLVVALLVVAILFAIFGPSKARAHGWYDADCCHQLDCSEVLSASQVQFARDTLPVLSVTTKHGTGVVSHDTKVKQSQDNNMHACIVNTEAGVYVRCIYLPPSN